MIQIQNASMGFAARDNLHHQEFLLQVEHYRRDFIKQLNDISCINCYFRS